MAAIADHFKVLPSVVAERLADDPDQLDALCLPLIKYAEAKAVFDSNDKKRIDAWKGSKVMDLVKRTDLELKRAYLQRMGG